jgi:hypothetical protein
MAINNYLPASDSCRTCLCAEKISVCLTAPCHTHESWLVRYLSKALIDLMDGQSKWWEVQANTGLSDARCEELSQLWALLVKKEVS